MGRFIADETPWQGGRVSERAWCVRADNPSSMTYVGTNTWVVAEPGSKKCLVIDPAPAGTQVERIVALCDERALEIAAIFVTHDHPDHTEGVAELAARADVPVFARDAAVLDRILEGRADIERHTVSEGAFCPFEGVPSFEVIDLPGHSTDSVGLLMTDEKALFTGDMLFRHGPTVVFYPDGVLGDYLHSLDTLEALVDAGRAQRFYPGHGYPIDDPARIIEATRAHRIERLDQIREALAEGVPADPDALFEVVYRGVDPRLRDASIRSIKAQLAYLGLL